MLTTTNITTTTTPSSPSNPQRKKVLMQVQQWSQFVQAEDEEFLEVIKNNTQYRPIFLQQQEAITVTNLTPIQQQQQEVSTHPYEQQYTNYFVQELEHDQDVAMTEQLEQLNKYKTVCDTMIQQVQESVQLCEDIKEQYQFVATRTGQLHKDCEKLVYEKDNLARIVDGIEGRLKYFNDMEYFTQELNLGTIDLYNPEFAAHIKLLDESIRFLSVNPSYRESKQYLGKYRQLMNRSLGFIRDHLLVRLKQATAETLKQEASVDTTSFDKSVITQELSLFYIQYRASIETIKPLVRDIELRAPLQEYTVYLLDIVDNYFEQRRLLMYKRIDTRIQELIKQNDLLTLVRVGCAYLMTICSEEEKLFRFFFSSDLILGQFRAMIELFCGSLYDGLRAMVIHQDDLDVLCDLVDILRGEMLLNKTVSNAAIEPVVHRMIQDVQERLIFRASVFIGERIRSFKPIPEDYNYPERLAIIQKDTKTNYDNWYPTLGLTLSLLSKLYRTLDLGVFESLAQETVSLCTNSFIDASKKIAEKKTVVDAELFLIKHLLTLCEQLSAFNVNFKSTQISLDFSNLREGISKFLRGQSKVSNLIFDIMSQSRPKIIHSHVDSKKDLENHLKTACESFILNVARLTMDPLMLFLKNLSAHKKNSGSLFQFVSVAECKDLFNTTITTMQDIVPNVRKKMAQYLAAPATQDDLFKHIKAQLVDRYQEFYSFVENGFTPEQQKELSGLLYDVPAFVAFVEQLAAVEK